MVTKHENAGDTAFLDGGGAATRLILARDWSTHELGPPAGWPEGLKTALSLILNSPESMILCWGRDDLIFFFNETYFPLLGPRLDWAMGARFDEVWADGLEQAMPIIADAFAGHSPRFVDLPWKLDTDRGAADTWWSFSYSRILDARGAIAGLFIFTNETTERVLTDRALLASQADLLAMNETLEQQVDQRTAERDRMWNVSPDLMVMLSHDRTIRRVNPAWAAILGYGADELVGRDGAALVHPEDLDATAAAFAVASGGTLPRFENRFRHRDGSYRWIEWVAASGPDEVFAVGRHVTEAKEAEARLRAATEQLQQAQKMDAIGQLTGGVAHDFNNLLTIIRGSVDLLKRPDIGDDKRARYIDAIGETADRATKLTGQLLAFARRQALSPELIDLGQAMAGIADMVGTLVGDVRLKVGRCEEACLTEIDRSQFETAVVNLAINARDAMDGHGRIDITVGVAASIPALRGHGTVAGDYVTVTVRDEGSGIAAADLPRIFEPFFTTKPVGRGTGLGLSQVIGFAKQSGGDIDVTSVPGEGTAFTLYLPRVTGAKVPAAPAAEAATAGGQGLCVLLVEDNGQVGQFATDALAELGYDSVHASNATAALALIAQDPTRFQAVFTDVVMPGMNGVEFATVLREKHPALPVVLTSGYSHVLAEDGRHGFELLRKPYSIEQLSRTLKKVIGAR